jgi:ketosteroid isomerase-like protein
MNAMCRRTISAAAQVATVFAFASPILAQGLTPQAVEQHERAVFAAWNANDVARLVALDATGGRGFGYRTRDVRAFSSDDAAAAGLRAWYASMVYFRLELDEIHTAATGDTATAWGSFTEQFQVKGRDPEIVRVRFTDVWKRDDTGWHLLIYHRDSQPFDEKGRYVPRHQ